MSLVILNQVVKCHEHWSGHGRTVISKVIVVIHLILVSRLMLQFFTPFFLVVRCSPGQAQLPTSLYLGWRNQQAEAHWAPYCSIPSDLTPIFFYTKLS